jgi:3-oxoacyl-[acyl-carrier-protein] synthase II
MPDRDVVIAGLGVVSPAGSTPCEFWQGMTAGRSYVRWLDPPQGGHPDSAPLPAATIDGDDWAVGLRHAERRRLDRTVQLGLMAAQQAVDAAGLPDAGLDPGRLGLVAGIGFGGITTLTDEHRLLLQDGARRLSPFGVATVMPSAMAAFGALRFGAQGPVMTVTSACASGTQALAEASRLIQDGSADVVIAGGAEAPLAELPMACFNRMKALAGASACATSASRPFDADRSGFVLGEGSGFMVVADGAVAERLGLPVLAHLTGWGITTDAYHITAPDPQGDGARRCLEAALQRSGHDAADITHVNAHGTGTKLNDAAEAAAIQKVFGAFGVPVTSAKGAIGHLMGGAGGVESVLAVQSMRAGTVPPTVNCDAPDPLFELDIVTGSPRPVPAGPVLKCSFAFGGQNAAVVFSPA